MIVLQAIFREFIIFASRFLFRGARSLTISKHKCSKMRIPVNKVVMSDLIPKGSFKKGINTIIKMQLINENAKWLVSISSDECVVSSFLAL